MADETKPVETKEPVPVVETVAETALGPDTKIEAPVEAEQKPADVEIKAEEKPVEAKAEPAKTEEKPAEVKDNKPEVKVEEQKEKPADVKAEEKQIDTKPVEIPKFEALKLPEGVKLEDKQLGEIDSMFGNFELTAKAPHAEVERLRQGMVEYGLGVIKDTIAQTQKQATEYWDKKTKEYREAFEKDPDIGGKRKDTTTEAARQFISQHAGTPEQAQEIRKLLYDHKLADHPAMIRLLANANLARSEGKPIPAQKAVAARQGKLDRMYGSMKE